MFKWSVGGVLSAVVVVTSVSAGADESLLSNNIQPGEYNATFAEGTQVLPTEMSATWVTEGEYATDEETVQTSRRGGSDRLVIFDGNTGTNWKSRTYSTWGKGKWVTLNVDLGKPYAVSKVDVWAMHEAPRSTGMVEVHVSQDGSEFVSLGAATSETVELEKDLISPIHVVWDTPETARFIQIRMKIRENAKQQQIGEIAIWGHSAD